MMEERQLAHDITRLLNEALMLDPVGFSNMILAKHPINEALAEHLKNIRFDHIRPLRLDGNSTISNIQLLCQDCHVNKNY